MYSSVVYGQILVAVQPRRVPNAIEPVGALIYRQAGTLTKAVRTGAHCVGRQAKGNGIANTQIDKVESKLDRHEDMDIVV